MLDERNKFAFKLILQARKSDQIPEEVHKILESNSETAIIDRLVPLFVRGQQQGQFIDGNPREVLSWYFTIINSLIMHELSTEEYGLPNVDVLIRILAK
jgi:hypothetical protein